MVGGGGVHIPAFRGGVVKSGFHKSKSISTSENSGDINISMSRNIRTNQLICLDLQNKKVNNLYLPLAVFIAQLLVGRANN